jgi:hypothetical protein
MHRSTELGLVYGPYGGIGFIPRTTPRRTAVRFSVIRWFMKLFA